MVAALLVLAIISAVLVGTVAWRNRKWRLTGRDRYTRLGKVKEIPHRPDRHRLADR